MAFDLKSQNNVKPSGMPDSYYQKGINGFISQAGYFIHSAANWRFFACSMVLVNLLCVVCTVYFASRSVIVPYIVEVDNSTGAVLSASKVSVRSQASRQETEYFLWEIVKKVRTLPKDMVLYQKNWSDVYAFMNQNSAHKINEMAIRENHKQRLSNGETTMITLKSISLLTGRSDTYNVRWSESWFGSGGQKMYDYEFECYFTVDQIGVDKDTVYINPLGLVIKDFSISQVQ